jgi:hypothetical protein
MTLIEPSSDVMACQHPFDISHLPRVMIDGLPHAREDDVVREFDLQPVAVRRLIGELRERLDALSPLYMRSEVPTNPTNPFEANVLSYLLTQDYKARKAKAKKG